MTKNTIVTLSDANYFSLLEELIQSIRKFKQSEEIDICVLDAGLTSNQIDSLNTQVNEIKKAEWDIEIPFYKKGKEWLKSQISRAFLPKYFPNYDKYLWIDCDAWVNSWHCIENYFKACEKNKLGITQSIGPGYRSLAKVNWIFGKFAAIKTQNYKHAKMSGLSESDARQIAFAPHLNIGVFSLMKNSSSWEIWQKNLKKTLLKGRVFGSEGLAINMSVYLDKVDTEFLPLSHNWITSHLLPIYDENNKTFKEPFIPHNEIGIMHLAAGIWKNGVDMRVDKNIKVNIKSLEGKILEKSLRYKNN
tara:strand:- start:421 stop:1332 length:912 start_codon:yes stop_codon:yes gene_type:complete